MINDEVPKERLCSAIMEALTELEMLPEKNRGERVETAIDVLRSLQFEGRWNDSDDKAFKVTHHFPTRKGYVLMRKRLSQSIHGDEVFMKEVIGYLTNKEMEELLFYAVWELKNTPPAEGTEKSMYAPVLASALQALALSLIASEVRATRDAIRKIQENLAVYDIPVEAIEATLRHALKLHEEDGKQEDPTP